MNKLWKKFICWLKCHEWELCEIKYTFAGNLAYKLDLHGWSIHKTNGIICKRCGKIKVNENE